MIYDTIVVGAGPAGLTAATYLGRFRRRVLVLDGGPPRASWIPESHNTPGFPQGVSGRALLARMQAQARLYGAEILEARAEDLVSRNRILQLSLSGREGAVRAPYVLLATGVLDRKPDIPGLDEAIRRALVRICPICDAYEAIDQAIAVLGDGPLGAREAMFLRTYSERVTLLHAGPVDDLDQPALRAAGIEIVASDPSQIDLGDKVIVNTSSGLQRFDCVYLAMGCEMQNRLAVRWGAAHDAEGNLLVDAHQHTSIEGVYAAGDVVRGLNQIAVATAEAAIAATDIHRRLRDSASPG
jgi:thioredoxin reductase (NADPH)